MKLYTYSGATPQEALKKAQIEHGDEALVVENKEIRAKSLSQMGLYEVVVAVREQNVKNEIESIKEKVEEKKRSNNIQERLDAIAQKELEKKRAAKLENNMDEDVSLHLSHALREIKQLQGIQLEEKLEKQQGFKEEDLKDFEAKKSYEYNRFEKPDFEAKNPISKRIEEQIKEKAKPSIPYQKDEIKSIKQELDKLNDKMKLMQNMLWEDLGPKNEGLNIPHEFAEIYRITKTSGIHKAHLDSIMSLSLELMPLKMRENSLTIKRYFREVLRKMVYCRAEAKDLNKKIIMLVGPTGVGKTTALAKLAARFSLEKKVKVGIITLDSYRIGALEQLEWYAERMRISIQMVMAQEDFLKALDSLRYCDYILVDTAGHSQNDNEKIAQIKKYLHGDYKIDVSLVMSATTKFEDLRDIYNAFSTLNIDTFIFSKLDESRGLGNIFSLVYETKKPISYFSIGQEVPTDLMVSSNEALIDWLLDGFINPNK